MKATLASITKPLEVECTPEEWMARCARVSSPQNQDNHDTALKLLKYCLVNGHWSVFEQVDMTLKIETSRAIMAQILRHWSFRFQEFSLRYSTANQCEPIEIRLRHKEGNRQGSSDTSDELTNIANELTKDSFDSYSDLIDMHAALESARFVLPLATTTTAYMKGSVRSWITYFWQRLDPHAQKEHRELAEQMFNIFEEIFPNIAVLVKTGKMKYVSET